MGARHADVSEERFVVRSTEVDPLGRMRVTTLSRYLQEAAARHAVALGVARGQLGDGLTWMLSRLAIRMGRWPTWRDEVVVTTWPSDRGKLHATRDFVYTLGSGEPLGVATSAWAVVDVERRRPVRLPGAVLDILPPERPRALELPRDRLPDPEGSSQETRYPVRWSECDCNQHANQAAYVRWALDSSPAEALRTRRLTALDAEFRGEARHGDAVIAAWVEGDDGILLHHLRDENDRELARLRTVWV